MYTIMAMYQRTTLDFPSTNTILQIASKAPLKEASKIQAIYCGEESHKELWKWLNIPNMFFRPSSENQVAIYFEYPKNNGTLLEFIALQKFVTLYLSQSTAYTGRENLYSRLCTPMITVSLSIFCPGYSLTCSATIYLVDKYALPCYQKNIVQVGTTGPETCLYHFGKFWAHVVDSTNSGILPRNVLQHCWDSVLLRRLHAKLVALLFGTEVVYAFWKTYKNQPGQSNPMQWSSPDFTITNIADPGLNFKQLIMGSSTLFRIFGFMLHGSSTRTFYFA